MFRICVNLRNLRIKSSSVDRLIYLHGFASSPQSSKARFFGEKFAALGRSVETPDLTEGDFEHSTLSQQMALLDTFVGDQRAVLMGSSMGGYLAALYAARHKRTISRVVLMAPAFGLAVRWTRSLGFEAMGEWQRLGYRDVFHYGQNRQARVSYNLIADGLQYEEFPYVQCPALVIHGIRDESVDYKLSTRFCEGRPNAELVLYDSDHQLLDKLDPMWERVSKFLA
jgi:pimeloyl-ACP methyl ester carboxylesterase